MSNTSNLWGIKNQTLSDKSAEKEYGISRKGTDSKRLERNVKI